MQACYQMADVCQRIDRLDEAEQYRTGFQTLQSLKTGSLPNVTKLSVTRVVMGMKHRWRSVASEINKENLA